MWRLILPLVVLFSLVGCAANPAMQTGDDLFLETGESAGEAVGQDAAVSAGSMTGIMLGTTQAGLIEIGQQQAPHTLLLFATPGSPYSQQYVESLLPGILRGPVTDGTLRVHIAFVPFQKYPSTDLATQSLYCGSFQRSAEYRALPMVMQNAEAFRNSTPPGANVQAFNDCMGNKEMISKAMNHQSIAQSLGVTVVPTAFLDGEKQVGLPDKADLEAAIRRVTAE